MALEDIAGCMPRFLIKIFYIKNKTF